MGEANKRGTQPDWHDAPTPIADLLANYHAGHDCKPAKCACKCGCQTMLGCTNMTDFCSVCHLSWVRDDDDDHGPIQPDPKESGE